ncbi:MAG: hypothetical protein O3A93_00150 [Chloroflexi bacterium]|nr:hypothetical protein [Chloroflexota bacterium]MDA1269661.1 hypothetical protein [Chloroflexota bacterium]
MIKVSLATLLVLAIGSVAVVFTASNTVPPTSAGMSIISVGPNEIKPRECSGITVTNIVIVTDGLQTGTAFNDLMLGSATVSVLDGGAGDDCIVTGNLAAVITGGLGNDVCIGKITSLFDGCESEVIRP